MEIISDRNRRSFVRVPGMLLALSAWALWVLAGRDVAVATAGILGASLLGSLIKFRVTWRQAASPSRAVSLAAACALSSFASLFGWTVAGAQLAGGDTRELVGFACLAPAWTALDWAERVVDRERAAFPTLIWCVYLLLPCAQLVTGVFTWPEPRVLWAVQVAHTAVWWVLSVAAVNRERREAAEDRATG